MVSGVAATRVSPVWVSRGTPMCTSNLLHDLFAFDFCKKASAPRVAQLGRPISTTLLK
jgi:hypothetical protein